MPSMQALPLQAGSEAPDNGQHPVPGSVRVSAQAETSEDQSTPRNTTDETQHEQKSHETHDWTSNDDSENEFDEMQMFQHVLDTIKVPKLKEYAEDFRHSRLLESDPSSSRIPCKVHDNTLNGSYNLVYILEFEDGMKWIARIPIMGARFTQIHAEKMNVEYSSTEFIRKSLGIPVPEVYTWESTCDRIGVPFALLEFKSGTQVIHKWSDEKWATEEKKRKILTNLANIMAKLQQPRFDCAGSLQITEDGVFSHIGPNYAVVEDDHDYLEHGIIQVEKHEPYHSVEDWLLDDLDNLDDVPDLQKWQKGCVEVLKLAAKSIPSYLRCAGRFELDFPDYNDQNILIDDDCNITGIIDWDGVRTVPQGMGCTRYPAWITVDWDPFLYDIPEKDNWEDSVHEPPEVYARYRKHYAEEFLRASCQGYDPRETRVSHILEAIRLGLAMRPNREFIMTRLLNHANGDNSHSHDPYPIAAILQHPTAEEAKALQHQISQGFRGMWHAEWEEEEPVLLQRLERKQIKKFRKYWAPVTRFLAEKQQRLLKVVKG